MKSPFTGGAVKMCEEKRIVVFRGQEFMCNVKFFVCLDTNQTFTTEELDKKNLAQVYDAYREKYGIPTVEEIKHIRQKYGLSAAKMSEILGLGINQYRLYEQGEMPSEMVGKMLRVIENPIVFQLYVTNSRRHLKASFYEKIISRLEKNKCMFA